MKTTRSDLITASILSTLTLGMHVFLLTQSDKIGWIRVIIYSLIYTAIYLACAYLPKSKYVMSAWTIFNLISLYIFQTNRIKTIKIDKLTVSWDEFINYELFAHFIYTIIFIGGFLIISAIILKIIKKLHHT